MKTKEELNALKEEVETLNTKLAELNEEELKMVSGGLAPFIGFNESDYDVVWKRDGDDVKEPLKPGDYTASLAHIH